MKIKIRKLEHSALLIEHNGGRVAIDPGSMTSPTSCEKLRDLAAVLVTHQHGDHFDIAVLRAISAPVWGPADVAALATRAGIRATPLELGNPVTIAGIRIIPVAANHGPAVTRPVANFGFVIEIEEERRIYITGDMAGSQGSTPTGHFVVVAVPVEGGGFVFDAQEAATFVHRIGHTGLVIPLHADDSPAMRDLFMTSASAFCNPIPLGIGEEVVV